MLAPLPAGPGAAHLSWRQQRRLRPAQAAGREPWGSTPWKIWLGCAAGARQYS